VLSFTSPKSSENGGGKTLADQLKAQALAANEWQPVLRVGDQTVSQAGFTDSGEITGKPQTRLGAPGELTAVWLDFVLQSPGTQQRVIRRELMDIRGPAARANGTPPISVVSDSTRLERGLALLTDVHVVPMVSDISPQFVLHESSQAFLTNRDLLLRVASAGRAASQSDLTLATDALTSVPAALYTLAFEREALSPAQADRYIDRINVLSSFTRPDVDRGVLVSREILDIANNEVAVWPGVPDPRRVQLEQGIADTFAEQAALPDAEPGENTADLFNAYGTQGREPVVVLPNRKPSLQVIDMTSDARARAEEDLAAGYGIVMPSQPVDLAGRKRFGWWRVDLNSGGSLGVMDTGFHQASSEDTQISKTVISPSQEVCGMVGAVGEYADFLRAIGDALSDDIMEAWELGLHDLRVALTNEKLRIIEMLHKC
jgi:hypothetical protein